MDDMNEESRLSNLRFSPAILRRLGEELNPSIDQGILELVKNSYDADAKRCTVHLLSSPLHKIAICDDGIGLSASSIVNDWLVLGQSGKSTDVTTDLGRVPAGNKGLGRLAALRLGRTALLKSRTGDGWEHEVKLEWDRFDRVDTVDEVPITISSHRTSLSGSGTLIELEGLRRPIGRVDVKRLARSLVLLGSPFGESAEGFNPQLVASEYRDLSKLVSGRYFDQAEYHLAASVVSGRASATVTDHRGGILWKADHKDLAGSMDPFDCPDSDFDFYSFILSPDSFVGRPINVSAVREWLANFGGVHVYSNGLRVAPYGNPGNDWLDINLSRARSPEDRPSTNNSIGRIRISDVRGELAQKTDRSGFIEDSRFYELRRFGQASLDWMARQRRIESEKKRRRARDEASRSAAGSKRTVRQEIEGIADPGAREQVEKAFEQYERDRTREAETLKREVQLYRTLSTAGITAATFAHESQGNSLKILSAGIQNLKSLKGKLDGDDRYLSRLERIAEDLAGATSSLNVLTGTTMSLIDAEKRRVGRVSPNRTLSQMLSVFQPFIEGRNVLLQDHRGAEQPYLRCAEAAIESIFVNLINNSLKALEEVDINERILRLLSQIDGDSWRVDISDSGPGLVGIDRNSIWLPGETTRPNGTGLGLTIVRDSVADIGGSVIFAEDPDLGGAKFSVALPLLGLEEG